MQQNYTKTRSVIYQILSYKFFQNFIFESSVDKFKFLNLENMCVMQESLQPAAVVLPVLIVHFCLFINQK